ncbi:MAG: peptidyl-prolyl cis-trans isomerase [Holosporales bacterium]|jgi:hypothetical protein|nr:peptidyl-prolyl cis-trans isomerase [Holosporales bacterium]
MNKKYFVYVTVVVLAIGTAFAIYWKTHFPGVPLRTADDKNSRSAEQKKLEGIQEGSALRNSAEEDEFQKEETPSEKAGSRSSDNENDSDGKSDDKQGEALVKFKNGKTITEKDIAAEISKVPEQLSSKMSYADLKAFISVKMAFTNVVVAKAKEANINKDKTVAANIRSKQDTITGIMFLNEAADKLMTDEALREHYDKTWEENFKGTKEYNIKVITTTDKAIAEKIKSSVKDEQSLNKTIKANQSHIKTMDLDNRAEASLPVEIADQVKKQGKNALIGPLLVKETHMLFFVKSVNDAKKQEFTAKFKKNYKKIAMRDFSDKVLEAMYVENKARIIDSSGKEVDLKKVGEMIRDRAKARSAPADQFSLGGIKDDTIIAYIGDESITAAELKKFFKIPSFEDQAFIMMAKQLNMGMREVIVYATKLLVDDKLLLLAAKKAKFAEKKEVKDRCREVADSELERAFLKKNAGSVTPEDTKREFNSFMKSIPEEDKHEHEISVRVILFKTKEEAEKALKSIKSGETKFNEMYKSSKDGSNAATADLGYINKRSVDPEFWGIIKKASSGTCHKGIIEIDGEKLDKSGFDYAVAYVGDKRLIKLPSLSSPQEREYFEELARRHKKLDYIKALFVANIETIHGKDVSEFIKEGASSKMLEALAASS